MAPQQQTPGAGQPEQTQRPGEPGEAAEPFAIEAIESMARERHGEQAARIILRLWEDDSAHRFLLGTAGENRPAGYLAYRLVDDASCVVSDLFVKTAERRRGVARRLLRRLTQSGDGRTVQLHVIKGNTAAEALYRAEGLVEVDAKEQPWTERDKRLLQYVPTSS